MKHYGMAALVGTGLLLLAPTARAQRVVDAPEVTSITPTRSYDPGPVVIFGNNLNTVYRVFVDGVEVPIDIKRSKRLVIWLNDPPAALDPGFSEVVVDGLGLGRATGVLRKLPTLAMIRHRTELELVLRTGGPGYYSLFFSFGRQDPPITLPNTHYMLMIDMLGSRHGKVASGFTFSRGPMDVVTARMPAQVILAGQDLYLQAWTQHGLTTDQLAEMTGGKAAWVGELEDGGFYPTPVHCSFTNLFVIPAIDVGTAPTRTVDVTP